MRCATHPGVETNLRCGKCGKPICPKCMVQTPVGTRCPDCAKLYRLPTFHVSTKHYLRAVGTGLGMAIVCGVVWGVVGRWTPFNLNLLLAPGVGYAIGQVVGLSVNRKRGTGLAAVGGVAVAISYIVSLWFVGFLFGIPFHWVFQLGLNIIIDLLALALGIFVAVTRLR
ncbi:B-box zinc finger protein [Chloroflexota bacterium]